MRLASVSRFPVKSMQGEQVAQALLGPRGLLGDRAYAVVDVRDGTVASAKHPRKWGALLGLSARFVDEPVPDAPVPPVVVTLPDGTALRSDAPGTDAALSALLGREVHLTSEVPGGARFEEQWPDIDGLAPEEFVRATTTGSQDGDPVSTIDLGMLAPPGTFLDVAPVHLLTTSTLDHLSALTPGPAYDPRRYRPNLLVEGAEEGFAEDAWVGGRLQLGEAQVRPTLLTMRCVMTTLAQEGLAEDRETLRGVARHHRREIPGLGTWACAGVYGDVVQAGWVRPGDAVTLA